MPEHLTAALDLAASGARVFPCAPGRKVPLTEHGYLDATTDPATIRSWWTRWPTANIANPTGGGDGYDVIDVDVRDNGSGWAAFHRARQAGLLAGWIRAVQTPSGGMHLYFLGTNQRSGSVPTAHIDFRGSGGYILVPPSKVRRGDYDIAYAVFACNDRAPGPVDWDAVRSLLTPERPAKSSPSLLSARTSELTITERLGRWISGQTEGNRNAALFWAACRAAECGATDPKPLIDAAVANGLSDREATTTVNSAYRRVHRSPQALPSKSACDHAFAATPRSPQVRH